MFWALKSPFRRCRLRRVSASGLGRDLAQSPTPFELKRWSGRAADDAAIDCWGRADFAATAALEHDEDALYASRLVRARDDSNATVLSNYSRLSDATVQRNTLECLDALRVDLDQTLTGIEDVKTKQASSLFGARDPYPNLAKLVDEVRAWLQRDPDMPTPATPRDPNQAHPG